ncbi:uncharacterized protein LOC129590004 [Paramacrobiotus metropolitanus]|uniref:uncharacterized protein LOC129590004 n=1 Tax=Paramacrobiotus metropolitanus TaxID=2943436 RepID=UPI002445AAB3|nr:uncharacterized protein LOC129590004 [Paramacrobiotus metropolitanus]
MSVSAMWLSRKMMFPLFITTAVVILPLSADFPQRSIGSGKYGYGMSDSAMTYVDPRLQPVCRTFVMPACDPRWLYCACGKPVFNVSDIPIDKSFLYLGEQTSDSGWGFAAQCDSNCLLPEFDSLPPHLNLSDIRLSNIWVAPNDAPFPVGRFLINVKRTVQKLHLVEIYLPTLTRDTFAGFTVLQTLQLERNRMTAIALDALEAFVPPPGNTLPSQLEWILINGNSLQHFDWSVFMPLADTIKHIALETNDIHQVYPSRLFVMRRVESVSLAGNNLTVVDSRFLDSLVQAGWRSGLNLGYNPLCTTDVLCRCPSLFSLWDWLTNARARITQVEPGVKVNWRFTDGLTCGNYTDILQGDVFHRFSVSEKGGLGKAYKGVEVEALANLSHN